jgi:hypothetical protein
MTPTESDEHTHVHAQTHIQAARSNTETHDLEHVCSAEHVPSIGVCVRRELRCLSQKLCFTLMHSFTCICYCCSLATFVWSSLWRAEDMWVCLLGASWSKQLCALCKNCIDLNCCVKHKNQVWMCSTKLMHCITLRHTRSGKITIYAKWDQPEWASHTCRILEHRTMQKISCTWFHAYAPPAFKLSSASNCSSPPSDSDVSSLSWWE